MKIPGTDVEYNPTVESGLYLVTELKPEIVTDLKVAAKHLAFIAARKAYPNRRLVVRDMTAQDLEITNIEWGDTSGGSANVWEDHQVAAAEIDDGKFVAIFGCRMMEIQIPDELPITALKFTVGGSEVARWDLYKAYAANGDGVTLGSLGGAFLPIACITDAPIVISEGIGLTISQWVATITTTFVLAMEGYVCELEGITLKP
ncbi:hypothetical protein ES703_93147 [subsurface metagenome]